MSIPVNPFDMEILAPYINGFMNALGVGATAAMAVFLVVSGIMFIVSAVRSR